MRTTRRQFLLAGGALVATACGTSARGTTATSGGATTSPASAPANGYNLVQRFPNTPLFVPGQVRLPISLAADGSLATTGPATLRGAVLDSNDKVVQDITATMRGAGIVVPYWDFRATIESPGTYVLRAEGDDGAGAAFQVFAPADVTVPTIGSTLPPFDTPTVADHRGVEPYCSLTPAPCPLHDITLRQALTGSAPVAYMIGTPAHCQTGTCAPGLGFLVDAHQRLGATVAMVHADVYTDDTATSLAPAVTFLNLTYEPVVYLCAPGGLIRERLDGIWNGEELDEALTRLTS